MSLEEDLRAIFGDRVDTFRPEGMRLLRRLWEAGRKQGRQDRELDFYQGRNAGLAELSVMFTEVIRGLPINEVFQEDGHDPRTGQVNFKLQPWVWNLMQRILDAPDLDSAREVARELGPISRAMNQRLEEQEAQRRAETDKYLLPDRWEKVNLK